MTRLALRRQTRAGASRDDERGSPRVGGREPAWTCLDFIKDFSRLLRTCSEQRDEYAGMSDFLVVLGIVLFAVVMLALIKGLERV